MTTTTILSTLSASRDIICMILSNLFFFRLGIYLCDKLFIIRAKIAHKLGVKNLTSRLLFATIFTLSCSIFQTVILEILQITGQEFRLWSWKFCLVLLISFLIIVLPLYQISLLISDVLSNVKYPIAWKVYIPVLLALYAIYLYVFWWLTNPFPLTKEQELVNEGQQHIIQEQLSNTTDDFIATMQDSCMCTTFKLLLTIIH
jgi:hypothetical protein